MKNKRFAVSEAAGVGAICAAGYFLYAAFPLFGPGALTILFGAVNESLWEHAKVLSAAYAGYALLQLMWIETDFRAYVAAKCAGLYLLIGSSIALRWGSQTLFGGISAAGVLLSAATAVILAQLVSYRLAIGVLPLRDWFAPALFLLALYYLMFFSFTILPPKAGVFRDPITGGFGCPDYRKS